MKTQLLPGETLIKDGAANLQRGIETVGGRVHLTSQRLVFESHAINVQTGITIIPLESITGVDPVRWTPALSRKRVERGPHVQEARKTNPAHAHA